MIKRCNDFGAGGVCVAIGELADGLQIDLDAVPKKYEGLDGTELAISESQERMAVVVDKADAEKFIALSIEENLEATIVAKVTDNNRLEMTWRGDKIVDLSRDFLNTNGVVQHANVEITGIDNVSYRDEVPSELKGVSNADALKANLSRLEVASQKDLLRDLTHQSAQAPFLCHMPANISSHLKKQWLQKFRFLRAKQTRQQLCLTALCQRFLAGHRSIRQHLPLRNHLQNLRQ